MHSGDSDTGEALALLLKGVADVMNGEISNTLGYVLQHLVVNIQAINTVKCQHPEWHPSYVIECMSDDLLI